MSMDTASRIPFDRESCFPNLFSSGYGKSSDEGFEKIALYSNAQGEFTHAARQKEDGIWTSKLGDWEDIEHRTLSGLSGNAPAYGSVAKILKRPRLAQA